MGWPPPLAAKRRSITRQAAVRLIFSLGLFVVLLGYSSYRLYSVALQKSAHERSEDLATFYRTRLMQLDRDWDLQTRDFKVRLEVTRMLEDRKTSVTNLQAFMTVQGTNRRFQYLLIQNRRGDKVFSFGNDLDVERIPIAADEDSGWHFAPNTGSLYRVFTAPIWLGEAGNGRLAMFYEIDNGLLFNLATPGILLTAKRDGKPIASSFGQAGLGQRPENRIADDELREIPWTTSNGEKTQLCIDAPIKVLFTKTELAVGAATIPIIDGLILWFTLGFWLMRNARRINQLGGAVEEFTARQQPTATLEEKLHCARGELVDEISEVACTIEDMAAQTHRLKSETEKLLRRNHALMQNSMDGIHVMDVQGNIVEANDAFCRMLGYTQEEMAHLHVADLEAQWSAEQLRERFKELVGKSGRFETVHRRKDGTLINVEISISSIEIDGQFFSVAASRDITERKSTEEELKLSAQLLNTTSDSIFLLDLDGNFVFLNEAAWKSRGYTRAELMAMNVRELTTPEFSKLVASRTKEMLANGQGIIESEHRCKDGSIMSVEVVSRLIESGGRKLFLSSCRDISERKKNKAMLMQYKLVLETSIDGFWVTDMRGHLLEANAAYARMSGYAVAELVNMHISQLEAIELKPEDVQAHIAKIAVQGYDRFETRHRRKDGQEIDVEISVTHMAEPERLVVFCRDISVRKRIEQEMITLNNQLTDDVIKRTADLSALAARIQTISETEKSNLARELHDELGSTLACISMELGRLKGKLSSPDLLQDLSAAKALLSNATQITRGVIDQLYPTILNHSGFVAAVEWLVKGYREHSGITVELAIPKEEIAMEQTFALAAYRITQECLTNIAKHAGASKVRIEAKVSDGFLNLTIQDNGKGMPGEIGINRHGIFGMTERARFLGGSMEIKSEDGRGTTARLSLPLAAKPNNRKRVLVVDDHSIIRDAIRQLLEDETDDFSVAGEAADGKTAIEMAIEGAWDVMLLDISLPKKNGIQVLEKVAAAKPNLPIIMLSTHRESTYGEIARSKGAAFYIEKGETRKLVEAMRQATLRQ